MLSLHLIASEIKRLYISVLVMIVNRMAISLNKERKLCLTFGLRSIIRVRTGPGNPGKILLVLEIC